MFRDLDISILHFFNGYCRNKGLDWAVPFITEMGSGIFICALGFIMMFLWNKKVKMSGVMLIAGTALSYNIANLMKGLIMRPRPFITLSEVKALYVTDGFSFPSTHAAMAFVAAVILAKCFGLRLVFYFLALLVAISRVYLGLHYPSDVFVGALVGIVVGYVLVYVAESAGVYTEQHEKKV